MASRLRHLATHLQAPPPPPQPQQVGGAANHPFDWEPVLSAEHWASWHEKGYMVLEQAVPAANVQRISEAVYDYVGADPASPESWYSYEGGMMRGGQDSAVREAEGAGRMETTLNMWQHQAQWDNRQHPKVYRAFCELWGRHDLWVSMDDMEWKPPTRPDRPGWGEPLELCAAAAPHSHHHPCPAKGARLAQALRCRARAAAERARHGPADPRADGERRRAARARDALLQQLRGPRRRLALRPR